MWSGSWCKRTKKSRCQEPSGLPFESPFLILTFSITLNAYQFKHFIVTLLTYLIHFLPFSPVFPKFEPILHSPFEPILPPSRALLLLKKKRYMESLLDKSDGQLANIEQMVQTIEFQEMQIDIVERLKDGNEALRKLNEALDIDQIEDILQETKEGAEKQKEISRLFAGQAEADEQDEDELLRELKELTGEDAAGEQVAGEAGDEREPQLPEVSKEPVQIEDDEEGDVERTERVKANKKVLLEAS